MLSLLRLTKYACPEIVLKFAKNLFLELNFFATGTLVCYKEKTF